jgi:hypothetical protein
MIALKNMRKAARMNVALAAMDMFGSTWSIEVYTGIKGVSVKETFDMIDFIESEIPHITVILQKSISKRILKEFSFYNIVYDLSAIH